MPVGRFDRRFAAVASTVPYQGCLSILVCYTAVVSVVDTLLLHGSYIRLVLTQLLALLLMLALLLVQCVCVSGGGQQQQGFVGPGLSQTVHRLNILGQVGSSQFY
jgi:hypothetical protein